MSLDKPHHAYEFAACAGAATTHPALTQSRREPPSTTTHFARPAGIRIGALGGEAAMFKCEDLMPYVIDVLDHDGDYHNIDVHHSARLDCQLLKIQDPVHARLIIMSVGSRQNFLKTWY